jgi:hypothetical protein
MQASSEEMGLCQKYEEYYDDDDYDYDQYIPPKQHNGRKLRKHYVPYKCVISDEQLFAGLDWKLPMGSIKSCVGKGDFEFSGVRHAGSYVWKEPLMKDQLGVDHMALGDRVLITPGMLYLRDQGVG